MKPLNKKVFGIVTIFIVLSLCLFGCNGLSEDMAPSDDKEKINLNIGSVMKSENGEYKVLNYENGEFSRVDFDKIVLAYDNSSANYICLDGNSTYVITEKNRFELQDKDYTSLKLSKDGKYVSYFVEDNGLKLKVINTENNELIDLNSKVIISGSYYDWYDENTLMYYGVSEDGVNGIFYYDIENNSEELKYKIKEGFLAFFQCYENNIIFLKSDFQGNKEFMVLPENSDEPQKLSTEIEEVNSVIIKDSEYYFLGKIKDNNKSLYKVENKKVKRLVYDFPVSVKTDKGLILDNEGNILFIGIKDNNSSEEMLFKCEGDEVITSLFETSQDFMFINFEK